MTEAIAAVPLARQPPPPVTLPLLGDRSKPNRRDSMLIEILNAAFFK